MTPAPGVVGQSWGWCSQGRVATGMKGAGILGDGRLVLMMMMMMFAITIMIMWR